MSYSSLSRWGAGGRGDGAGREGRGGAAAGDEGGSGGSGSLAEVEWRWRPINRIIHGMITMTHDT